MNRLALALVAVVALPAAAFADPFTFTATDTPVTAPQPTTISSSIVIASGGSIQDMNVFVSYTANFIGDLVLTLTHVNTGTTVTLAQNRGGAGADMTNVTFDDEAAQPISAGSAPFGPASYRPEGLLSAFDNQNLTGTWTLTAVNPVNDGPHSIVSFQLTGIATPEPGTWALFGLGAMGLGAGARRRRAKAAAAKA
ncbi:MAG: PEP-CTERM sorting domain-containing protein [Planctomycetes bacterium]|nr:PEP-CTERM sorting domain-containing protein [Planctomycetota bacterium]